MADASRLLSEFAQTVCRVSRLTIHALCCNAACMACGNRL